MINYHRHLLRRGNPNRKMSEMSEDEYEMILDPSDSNSSDTKDSSAAQDSEQDKKPKTLSLADTSRETTESFSLLVPSEDSESVEKKLAVMSKNLRGRNKTFDFTATGTNVVIEKPSEDKFDEKRSPRSTESEKFRSRSGPTVDEVAKKSPQKGNPVQEEGEETKLLLPTGAKKGFNKKNIAPLVMEEEKVSSVPFEEEKDRIVADLKKPPKYKKNFNLGNGGGLELNVEEINKNFTGGGENMKKVITDMNQEVSQFTNEVDQLAKLCVQYMSRLFVSFL